MPRREAVQRRLSGRGGRDRVARDAGGHAAAELAARSAGSLSAPSLPNDERRPRHVRRYLDGAAKGVLRSANIMPAPEIEIVVDRNADMEEVTKRVKELREQGHTVVLTTPTLRTEPPPPVGTPNPLTGHDEIASATVRDDAVQLVVHEEPKDDQTRQALEAIGRAVAAHHGSAATKVEITAWRKP